MMTMVVIPAPLLAQSALVVPHLRADGELFLQVLNIARPDGTLFVSEVFCVPLNETYEQMLAAKQGKLSRSLVQV